MVEESFLKKLKRFSRDNTLELSILGLILGSIFTFIGIIGVFIPDYEIAIVTGILEVIGDWDYWLFMVALILTFAAAWFLYSNVKDRMGFKDLIDTGSKATFVRNQDELEEIAFRLGTKYQDILFDKKKELRIK
jgi:hypothetical protein